MSRKSYEKLGSKYVCKNLSLVGSKDQTLEDALTDTQDEPYVYIAGGQSIFRQTMHMVHGIFLIELQSDYLGDAFYPDLPSDMVLKYIIPPKRNNAIKIFCFEREWDYNS